MWNKISVIFPVSPSLFPPPLSFYLSLLPSPLFSFLSCFLFISPQQQLPLPPRKHKYELTHSSLEVFYCFHPAFWAPDPIQGLIMIFWNFCVVTILGILQMQKLNQQMCWFSSWSRNGDLLWPHLWVLNFLQSWKARCSLAVFIYSHFMGQRAVPEPMASPQHPSF